MIQIDAYQMEVLASMRRAVFHERVAALARELFPALLRHLSERELIRQVREAHEKLEDQEVGDERSVCAFAMLWILAGEEFPDGKPTLEVGAGVRSAGRRAAEAVLAHLGRTC